ncbi:hypothetical protein SAMN06265379_102205 [Saccharicrinis carchari]|uniref:Uncharacterized protein n=1 Tax=Saccharicrinis carchari TaxID=1168039 RepID=A0A521BY69_SACCC|nr:hypothetical protein SAMN06265379_102205 [Saccharicrinis carchari]
MFSCSKVKNNLNLKVNQYFIDFWVERNFYFSLFAYGQRFAPKTNAADAHLCASQFSSFTPTLKGRVFTADKISTHKQNYSRNEAPLLNKGGVDDIEVRNIRRGGCEPAS